MIHNEDNNNNIAISPYGAVSVLVALGEGVRGSALYEIQRAANIPSDISVVRIGLRDIHRHLKSYFIPEEGFLSGLSLSHDNVTLNREYEDILKFYGYDISSFNNALYPDISSTETPVTTGESSTETTVLEMQGKDETTTEIISTTTQTTETDSTTSTVASTEVTASTTLLPESTTEDIKSNTIAMESTATTSTYRIEASTAAEIFPTTEMTTTIEESSTFKVPETTTMLSTAGSTTTETTQQTTEFTASTVPDTTTEKQTTSALSTISTTMESTSTAGLTSETTSELTTHTTMKSTTTSETTSELLTSTTMESTSTSETTSEPTISTTMESTSTSETTSEPMTMSTTMESTSTSETTSELPTSTTMESTNTSETTSEPTTSITTESTSTANTGETESSTETTSASTTITSDSESTAFIIEDVGSDETTENPNAEEPKRRSVRSAVDYIIARYYDDHYITPRPPPYQSEDELYFLVNGKQREYNINFMTYDTVLPFYYMKHLNSLALRFPLDSTRYYLLLLLPDHTEDIDKLICNLRLNTSLKHIIDNLRYTHVKAVIPSFMLKGYVILTSTFQKMGIRKVFEPRQADFSLMTPDKNIYVTNIEQAITVNIRNYVDPITINSNRYLHRDNPVLFKADHPFLYFVIDSEIDVTLMAGKIINPLNSRIR